MNDSRFSPELLARMRGKILTLAYEGVQIRAKIRTSRALQRHRHWNEKRGVGKQARAWLLVYGFARDVPFERIERRNHEGNQPQLYWLNPVVDELFPDPRARTELRESLKVWLAARTPMTVSKSA